jgi:hypothetical protein
MTEQEYSKLLARIVKGAEYLSHPLIKPEDVERGMKQFDALCEQVLRYRNGLSHGPSVPENNHHRGGDYAGFDSRV